MAGFSWQLSMSISIESLKEAINIKESIEKLEARLAQLFGSQSTSAPATAAPAKKGRRGMSAAARAKISASTKARWARVRAASAAPAAKPVAKKRGLSPEGRAKIVAALKARWAKKKDATAAPAKAAKAPKKRKSGLSPEGRAKIVAALKKRWAKVKASKKK